MTRYGTLGGFPIPLSSAAGVGPLTLAEYMASADGMGQLFLDFTVTDAPYGNPHFMLSGVEFNAENVPDGDKATPAVLSWGSFQGGASSDISGEGGGRVVLNGNLYVIPVNGTSRLTVSQWIARTNWREVEASLIQWNALAFQQEIIWKGYILGVTESRFQEGVYQVELMLSASSRDMEQKNISDLITKADFPSAPLSSLNSMVPRAYGRADNTLYANANSASLAYFGYPMPGARGVVIDENQATAKVKVRFSKNDGASAWYSFTTGTAGDASSFGGLWVYDSGMGCYGMVDAGSYTVTNGVDYTEVVVDAAPRVFFYVPLRQIGSTNAAGFTDSNKIIDSDPNNYVTSDAAGNHSWAFYLPSVNFGGRVRSIGMIADWKNAHATLNRQITIGIWDIYVFGGGANWLGGGARLRQPTQAAGSTRLITMQDTATYRYEQSSFGGGAAGGHAGSATRSELSSGAFVTRNAADALEASLEMRVFVEDLGGAHAGRDGVRLYNVGMVVEVDYTATVRPPNFIPPAGHYKAEDLDKLRWQMKQDYQSQLGKDSLANRQAALANIVGINFFARGTYQRDDTSATYTGSGSAYIVRPNDIAYHMLKAVCGETVNVTPGTLGNFVDPRSSGLMQYITALETFGPDTVSRKASIERITSRFGLRIRRTRNGDWHCLPDNMNPHSSTVYASTAAPVEIGVNDIELSSFTDRELDVSDMVNSVQLNYSHGYPNRESGAVTTYENHLSQKWFGKKATEPYEYPELVQPSLDTAVDTGVTNVAKWLGRRSARPRRIVACSLFQKFYDLEPGHTLCFNGLENIGIPQQAYRAGLLDYQVYGSAATTTDMADNAAAVLISLTDSSLLFGLSQQTDGLDFSITTAANYTTVANPWRYSTAPVTFGNFAGVTNPHALKFTGAQSVRWTRPNWWEWTKETVTVNLGGVATVIGPCYWIYLAYSTPTVAGLANARTSYTPAWKGRYFEVLKATRRPGSNSKDYPYKDILAMEVM